MLIVKDEEPSQKPAQGTMNTKLIDSKGNATLPVGAGGVIKAQTEEIQFFDQINFDDIGIDKGDIRAKEYPSPQLPQNIQPNRAKGDEKQSHDELIEEYERKINKTIQLLEEEKKKQNEETKMHEMSKISGTSTHDKVKQTPDFKKSNINSSSVATAGGTTEKKL